MTAPPCAVIQSDRREERRLDEISCARGAVAEGQKHGISKRTMQNARAKLQGKVAAPRKPTPTPKTEPAAPSVHFSSKTAEHYTPQPFLELVREVLGEIDLDPCSNSAEAPNVAAHQHYTASDDGLKQSWQGRVFLNPPYGRQIEPWIEKLRAEWKRGKVTELIALVSARPDTEWFDTLTAWIDDEEFPIRRWASVCFGVAV